MYLSTRFKEETSTEMECFNLATDMPISVRDYMSRVLKKSQTSYGAAVSAIIYIDRLHERGHFTTAHNIHKVLMAASRCSAKVWDDSIIHPADYAFLAGLDHHVITSLEVKFSALLGFRLHVTVEEYNRALYVLGADMTFL